MSFQYKNSGLNNAAEYMASGIPFVLEVAATSGSQEIKFPQVTSEITISTDADAYIGFSETGIDGDNNFFIPENAALTFRIRTASIFIKADSSANVYLMAALTGIPANLYPNLSGSAGIG